MRPHNRFDRRLVRALLEVRDGMGWNPATLEKLPTRLMCVISELDEFEEAIAGDDREHALEELGDVASYLILTLYDLGGYWPWRAVATSAPLTMMVQVGELTRPVRRYVVRSMQAWRRLADPNREKDARIALELALLEVARIAWAFDFNLHEAIYAKLAVLRERPRTNGGKHPDS